jgi:hypothetical protein
MVKDIKSILDYPDGSYVITRVFIRGRQKGPSQKRRYVYKSRGQKEKEREMEREREGWKRERERSYNAATFENEGRGHEPRNAVHY